MKHAIRKLDHAVRAVCPAVIGVSVNDWADRASWRVDYAPEATDQDRAAVSAIVASFDPHAPTVADIVAERNRRLALGFDYDFGDQRGVHRIGTTDADLKGWGEVSTYAGALLDSGDTTTTIAIVTDTGPCVVTAAEWRAVEIAAAAFRQPIWAASFSLMQTLPTDYTADARWS